MADFDLNMRLQRAFVSAGSALKASATDIVNAAGNLYFRGVYIDSQAHGPNLYAFKDAVAAHAEEYIQAQVKANHERLASEMDPVHKQ